MKNFKADFITAITKLEQANDIIGQQIGQVEQLTGLVERQNATIDRQNGQIVLFAAKIDEVLRVNEELKAINILLEKRVDELEKELA